MKIQQSAEDYFETIYILKKRNGSVRAIDIVNEMGFSKPTVSVAMKKFRENGFVTVDDDGQIELTKLAKALMLLGVEESLAYEDACRMEHCISDISFEAIKNYLDKL